MPSRKTVAVIDPQLAGVSGDMLLGALIDLGASPEKIQEAFRRLSAVIPGCEDLELKVSQVLRHGIRGVRADIQVKERFDSRTGRELKEALQSYLAASTLSDEAKAYALRTLSTLLKGETYLHATSEEQLILGEMASADTLADIVGVTTALEDLGLLETQVYSLPVVVGSGKVKTSHGILTQPPPIVLEILREKNFPFETGRSGEERSTPTGVALLVNLAEPAAALPLTQPYKVGHGAGARDPEAVPNLLRVYLGRRWESPFAQEEVYLLETNLDDVSGETLGYLGERLMEEGARDFYIIPCTGKKGRPVHLLGVLAGRENLDRLADLVFRETGTLGIRVQPVRRFTLSRRTRLVEVEVAGKKFTAHVKIAQDREGKTVQVKPEFEDVRRISLETRQPLREVRETAKKEGKKKKTRNNQPAT